MSAFVFQSQIRGGAYLNGAWMPRASALEDGFPEWAHTGLPVVSGLHKDQRAISTARKIVMGTVVVQRVLCASKHGGRMGGRWVR